MYLAKVKKMMIYHKTSQSCVLENVFWTSVYDSKDRKKYFRKKKSQKYFFEKN